MKRNDLVISRNTETGNEAYFVIEDIYFLSDKTPCIKFYGGNRTCHLKSLEEHPQNKTLRVAFGDNLYKLKNTIENLLNIKIS